jgi:hypothetical protein
MRIKLSDGPSIILGLSLPMSALPAILKRNKEELMRITKCVLFLLLVWATISSLGAQVGQTGSIRGQVMDAQKAPLPGVIITVTSPRLMGKQSVVTNIDGIYKFPPILPPGTYSIFAELQGFNSVRRDNVVVRVGTTIDVNLEMAQAALNQQVTVTAPSPVVDVVSSSINQNTTTEVIETLPFTNREVWTLATTTTAGTRGTSIHGEAAPTYVFQIDGVQSNAADQNATNETRMDMETVQEVEFVTGGVDSTVYGARSGFMNVVTKAGGNDFHGMLQFYYTGEKLQQVLPTDEQLAALGLVKPAFAIYSGEMSATLGGPIFKDKLWFFGSFKYNQNKSHVSYIPTTIDGKYYGPYEPVQKQPIYFGKLTWQISPNLKVFSMLAHNGMEYPFFYTGTYLTGSASATTRNSMYTSSNSLTWVMNPNTILDVRVGIHTQDWTGMYTPDAVPGPYFTDSYTGYQWGNRGMQSYTYKETIQGGFKILRYQDDFLGGNHEFQAGFEYVRVQGEWGYWRDNPIDWTYYNGNRYYYRGLYNLTGPHPLYGDGALTFNTYGTARGDSQNVGFGNRYGGFIQDSFTIKNRLTVTVGLRYDKMITDIPTQVKGAAGGSVAAAIGDYYLLPAYGFNPYLDLTYEGWHNPYPYSGLAPTIGLSYDLTGKGKTALKLHYGTYFDPASTGTWSGLQPTSPIGFSYYWTDLNGNGQPDSPPTDSYALTPGQNPLTMLSKTFKQQIDPNLKDPYTREFIAGIEHELFPFLKVGLTYVYRDHKNFTASLNYDTASGTYWNLLSQHPEWWVPFTTTVPAYGGFPARQVTVYYRSNNAPATFGVLTNVPEMKSTYSGLEFAFEKRMHDGWSLGGSFNYSYQWSNGAFTGPNTRINAEGRQGTVPWWVKLYGTFNIPYGFVASFIYLHTEGTYWGRSVSVSAPTAWITANNVNSGTVSATIEAPDGRLNVASDDMSFRIEKEFKVGSFGRLGVFADVFNLLGSQYISVPVNPAGTWKPTDNNTDQGTYTAGNQKPTGISGVRNYRLSIRFSF